MREGIRDCESTYFAGLDKKRSRSLRLMKNKDVKRLARESGSVRA
jgi:hypothetical protein